MMSYTTCFQLIPYSIYRYLMMGSRGSFAGSVPTNEGEEAAGLRIHPSCVSRGWKTRGSGGPEALQNDLADLVDLLLEAGRRGTELHHGRPAEFARVRRP